MTTMTKKRTAELEGAQLDWAVAQLAGVVLSRFPKRAENLVLPTGEHYWPSRKWYQGGPLIEREGIWIAAPLGVRRDWSATRGDATESVTGPTPLIAAMRAFVASKLGDEVEVPA